MLDIAKYNTVIFDCDGVLWHGSTAINGSLECLARLQAVGKRLLFISNNSGKSRQEYASKFQKLGFQGILKDQVITSGSATALYLATKYPEVHKVYVIGGAGLVQELSLLGIEVLGGPADNGKTLTEEEVANIKPDPSVKAVVVGHDFMFSYYKLTMASIYLQQGAFFFVTNSDDCDVAGPWMMPVNGPQVAALVAGAPGAKDPIVCGKPTEILAEQVIDEYQLDCKRTVMVGDRLDTDIAFGNRCGMDTVLVLTGVSSEEDVTAAKEAGKHDLVPNFIKDDLSTTFPEKKPALRRASTRADM